MWKSDLNWILRKAKHARAVQLLCAAVSSMLCYIYISWGKKILFLHKIQIQHVRHYKFSKFLRCNCNEEDWQSRHGQNIWGLGPWHATGIQRPFITLDGLFKGYFSSHHLLPSIIINPDFKLFFRQTILMSAEVHLRFWSRSKIHGLCRESKADVCDAIKKSYMFFSFFFI